MKHHILTSLVPTQWHVNKTFHWLHAVEVDHHLAFVGKNRWKTVRKVVCMEYLLSGARNCLCPFWHEQGFASLRNVQPPRYKNGVWTVVAQPPEGKKENTFVYEAGKFVITIRKWQKPKTITQDRWTSYGSSWITGKDNQHADTPMANSDDKDSEVKILPPRKSRLMLHLNLFHRENASMTNLAPNNTIILDLGGDGDCGYRSIAAAMALRSAKDLREVRENIESLVLHSAKVYQYLRDHDALGYWPNCQWSHVKRTYSKKHSRVSRCHPLSQTMAWWSCRTSSCKSPSNGHLDFWKPDKKWKMTARLQCEDGVLRDPIVLLLHNEHYRTISSPEDIPKSWKSATPKGVVSRGAGKSVKSLSSWLKPVSVIHARQSSNQKNTSCSSKSRRAWLKPGKIFKASSSKAESQAPDGMPSASSHKQSDQSPLCSVEIASVGNRAKLGWTRGNHLRDRHPNIERASVAGLKSQSQETCAVSYNLPAHAVRWSCPWCKANCHDLNVMHEQKLFVLTVQKSIPRKTSKFSKRHGGKLEILFCKYVVTMQT